MQRGIHWFPFSFYPFCPTTISGERGRTGWAVSRHVIGWEAIFPLLAVTLRATGEFLTA